MGCKHSLTFITAKQPSVRLFAYNVSTIVYNNTNHYMGVGKILFKDMALKLVMRLILVMENQWRIKEFQNRGARSRCGRLLGVWECFDALSHIFYVFVVRVEDKIDIVNTACWLQWKYLRDVVKIYKNNRGVRARCAGPGSAFENPLWYTTIVTNQKKN